MERQKLHLGILLDSFILPTWAYRSLEQVVNLNCVEIAVIILDADKDPQKYGSDLFYNQDHCLAYQLLSKVDKAIYMRGPDAFAPKDAQDLFSNVPIMKAKVTEAGAFNHADLEEIKNYHLDILIRMGFENLTGDIMASARYGTWSYYHGDHREIQSDLPGFWEVVNRCPETGSILYVMDNSAAFGKILYRSSIQTYLLSPVRNRNRCFWISAPFLSRQISLLYRLGENDFLTEIEKHNCETGSIRKKQYQSPSNFLVLCVYIRLLLRMIFEAFQRTMYVGYWYLSFDTDNIFPPSFKDFTKIVPPRDRYWADPHMIQKDGTNYIFVEEFLYKDGKGQISVIEVDPLGNLKAPIPVLVKDYHLSYPFVFEYDGTYYMVPESSQNNTIDLYECVKFPLEWKFKMNLISNVKAVDTTLFNYQGEWWLFTGITENEGALPEVELFLYYADDLFTTQWKPHALNPVVSDVKNSRPAGKLFVSQGKIYRPAQDCSKLYGYGFNLNEIEYLTHSEYRERKVLEVKPDWKDGTIATHTYTSGQGFTIIDGFGLRSKIF